MSATRSRSAGASSRYDCSRGRNASSPRSNHRRIAVEDHGRVVHVAHVDLRDPLARRPASLPSAAMTRPRAARAPSSHGRAAARADGATGRRRSAGRDPRTRGPYSSMIGAAVVDRDTCSPFSRAIADRARARRSTTSTVDGSERRSAASRTQGDVSSRARHASRSVHSRFSPAQPVESREHLARESRVVAAHHDAVDPQHARVRHQPRAAIGAVGDPPTQSRAR